MINVVLPKRAGSCPAPASLPIPCSAHRGESATVESIGRPFPAPQLDVTGHRPVRREDRSGPWGRLSRPQHLPIKKWHKSARPIAAKWQPRGGVCQEWRLNCCRPAPPPRPTRRWQRPTGGGESPAPSTGFDSCGWRFQYGGRRPLPRARARPRTKPATSSAMLGAGPASPRSAALPLGVTWRARLSR